MTRVSTAFNISHFTESFSSLLTLTLTPLGKTALDRAIEKQCTEVVVLLRISQLVSQGVDASAMFSDALQTVEVQIVTKIVQSIVIVTTLLSSSLI